MAIPLSVLMIAAGALFFSAFFSGSEIGFYRIARVRLVLDALAGDLPSRGLLWLSNHPSLFVATMLAGNNLANYVMTLAIVVGAQALVVEHGHMAELLAPLVLAPALFVLGELLPKKLFLKAPHRLLRKGAPLLLVFVVLFFPISMLLWGLNRLLARFVAESPGQVRLTLARRELQRLLEEGHDAGILHPAQQSLARAIFDLAKQPVSRFATPLADVPRARVDMSNDEILRLARRYRQAAVPVEDSHRELTGYARVIDLAIASGNETCPARPLPEIAQNETYITALTRMQSSKEHLARVVDAQGKTVGILTIERLREPLFQRKSRSY